MRNIIVLLLAVVSISFRATSTVESNHDKEAAVAQMLSTVSVLCLNQDMAPPADVQDEPAAAVLVEPGHFNDDIPLTREEQKLLIAACEEFDVPYALALGLIEKESDFKNIVGDNGASSGYMQIQKKWHHNRMDRLGVTDLMDSGGNFRVGLDFLSELYETYGDWDMALTVYNMGHNPGCISNYAKSVMGNYDRWKNLLENYD